MTGAGRPFRHRRSELEGTLDVMNVDGFAMMPTALAMIPVEALSDSRA